MILKRKINHNGRTPEQMFGLTEKRFDEITNFLDKLISEQNPRSVNVEKVIEFADTTLEAVLIFGFFEHRVTKYQYT